MKYLLIDFGASSIKTVIYDTINNLYHNNNRIDSPFLNSTRIQKTELINLINSLVEKNKEAEAIVACTILGGYYDGDVYVSWKENQIKKNCCLISGLFNNTPLFHVHYHHKNNTENSYYETKLKVLGYIKGRPIYSALADTMCAINSIEILDSDVLINIGTGSQVIYKQDKETIIRSFIPAGRSFLAINTFYKSIGLDFFDQINKLTIEDVINSSLHVDLNIFEQAHKYKNGGIISNITESNFDICNLTSSIIKSFVCQYEEYIINSNKKNLIVMGGIPKKSKLIRDVFSAVFEKYNPTFDENEIENTHRGIVNYINKFL